MAATDDFGRACVWEGVGGKGSQRVGEVVGPTPSFFKHTL